MRYAASMPLIPSSGGGICEDEDCPGKKSQRQAFSYLEDHRDGSRTTIMTQLDGRWVRNGRKKLVLPLDADGSR